MSESNGPINFELTGMDLIPVRMKASADVVANSDGVTVDVMLDGEKVVRVSIFVREGEIVAEMLCEEVRTGEDSYTAISETALIFDVATGNIVGKLQANRGSFDDPGVKVA